MQIIELPDGTEAEFPDDMTEEQIVSVIQKEFSSQPQFSAGQAAQMGVGQGLTLGFADELKAAGIAGMEALQGRGEFRPTYEQMRDVYREEQAAAQQQHPVAYGVGEVAGVLPAAVATAPMGLVGGSAAIGGAMGAGEAKELSDIPAEAAKGAAMGALMGGVVKAAAPVVQKGLEGVSKSVLGGTEMASKGLAAGEKALKDKTMGSLMKAGAIFEPTSAVTALAGREIGKRALPVVKKGVEKAGVNLAVSFEELAKRVPNKYKTILQQAEQRGGNALGATHYILMQQDPEYRKSVMEKEE